MLAYCRFNSYFTFITMEKHHFSLTCSFYGCFVNEGWALKRWLVICHPRVASKKTKCVYQRYPVIKFMYAEAVVRWCSVKKLYLKISQNCARLFFSCEFCKFSTEHHRTAFSVIFFTEQLPWLLLCIPLKAEAAPGGVL